MYWRRASIQDGQTPAGWRHCSETGLCDIRHRSKRIAFLESVIFSTCAYMQIFNFHDGNDVTIFRHSSYLPNTWSQTLPTSKRHTFRVSAFHRYHRFGVKFSCRLCAGQSKGTLKMRKMPFWDLARPTLQFSGIFHNITRPHLHFHHHHHHHHLCLLWQLPKRIWN